MFATFFFVKQHFTSKLTKCSIFSFKLQPYSTSLQLIKQHGCLPAGNDGKAVCGRVLSTLQRGRGRERHKHCGMWKGANLLHLL